MPFFFCLPGRMAITGCKQANGSSNAGYYVADETDRPEIRHHFAGSLSMQRAVPNTGSAIFGVMEQPALDRDGKATVFGRVVEGLDVVLKIPITSPESIVLGNKPVLIVSATVLRKQSHSYEPQKLPLTSEPKSDK